MAVQPLSAVLSEDQARARCASCFEVISGGGGGSRCSGCKRIWYCSRKCQQADWGEHRPECKAWTSQESGECFLRLFSVNVAKCLLFVRRAASTPRAAVLRDDPNVRMHVCLSLNSSGAPPRNAKRESCARWLAAASSATRADRRKGAVVHSPQTPE